MKSLSGEVASVFFFSRQRLFPLLVQCLPQGHEARMRERDGIQVQHEIEQAHRIMRLIAETARLAMLEFVCSGRTR